MRFLFGMAIGSWVGIVVAACVVAKTDGAQDRAAWDQAKRCAAERQAEALEAARVIAQYQGAIVEMETLKCDGRL